MKKKVIISLVLIAIMAFGIGAGSYAWFTSEAKSEDNVFTAGTLKIEANETKRFEKDINNIYPSWEDSNTITIVNAGTLPLKFRVLMEASESELFSGDYPLQIKINDEDYTSVEDFEPFVFGSLDVGASVDLEISYKLPEGASNDYQGKTGTLSFTFEATQTENPGWTEEYIPAEN